jgi:hypothetical protein
MSIDNLLEEAKRKFAIQDVFLCESKVWSNRQLALGSVIQDPGVQYKLDEKNECAVTEGNGPTGLKMYFVQYFVGTSVRVFAGHDGENNEDKLVATIAATFVVRYVSESAPSEELIAAFNDHAIHHAWPYWREYVESTTTRIRVPTVVLPLRVVATPASGEPPSEKSAKE